MAPKTNPLSVIFKITDLYERTYVMPDHKKGTSYHAVVEGIVQDSSSFVTRMPPQVWELKEKKYKELCETWKARTCESREVLLRGDLEASLEQKDTFP